MHCTEKDPQKNYQVSKKRSVGEKTYAHVCLIDNLVGVHSKTPIIFDQSDVRVHYEQPSACIYY